MKTLFVAGYPWWSVSDPLTTFLKYCRLRDRQCALAGVPLLPFAAEGFPPEPEFKGLPIFEDEDLSKAVKKALDGLDIGDSGDNGENREVVFLDDHALETGLELVPDGVRKLYYSMELPPDGRPVSGKARKRLAAMDGIIIQDRDRLNALRGFYGPRPDKAWLMPNAGLAQAPCPESVPEDLSFLADRPFILMTGSLIPEHSVMEMTHAWLADPGDTTLVINGWGVLAEPLAELAAKNENLVLSTKFRPGREIRWLTARCMAGVVAYADQSTNHRLCGLSSGKLLWLARFAKPVLHNDNQSISRLARDYGLGLPVGRTMPLGELEIKSDALSAAARRFYKTQSRAALDALDDIFGYPPCAS